MKDGENGAGYGGTWLDDTLSDGTTQIESIDNSISYGGFWVGRYEAGLDVDFGSDAQINNSTDYRDFSNKAKPIIVEGAIPWNNISYQNAKINSEKLIKNSYVISGLINGKQWDTTIAWIKKNTSLNVGDTGISTDWGNYRTSNISLIDRYPSGLDSTGTWQDMTSKSSNSDVLLRTGASTQTKSLNISDLAGNLWEMTNEISSDGRNISRGESYAASDVNYSRAMRMDLYGDSYKWAVRI